MATAEYTIPATPFFLQVPTGSPIYYSAKDFRNYTGSMQRRIGILGSSHFRIQQATNVGWTIKVNSGYANVGIFYMVFLADDIELSIPMRPPTSGTRVHKVWVAVYDPEIQGNTGEARIVVTEDPGTGAPTPTGAAASLPIGTISIAKGQANIQNTNIVNNAQHGGSSSDFFDLSTYLADGYSNAGSPTGTDNFRGVYDNGVVRLSGMIKKDSGNFPSNTDINIGTMHANLRPKRHRYLTGACAVSATGTAGGTYTWRFSLDPDGTMTARIPSTQAPPHLMFDGIAYDLD